MIIVTIALWALCAYLGAYVAYQLLLFTANAVIPDPPAGEPGRIRRFNILVPAHNEELYLPRLLASIATQDYPAARYAVTVVADNCTDNTVSACEGLGATVVERHDQILTGKGHAIRWALERIGTDQFDAFVIVDGDSIVAPEFIKHLNLRMEDGDRVIQCYNGVANPGQSWFTRLMDVSRTISNEIIHPAKRKLGLSSHLMGNGMCFDVEVLKSQNWDAFSIGEDWEYYARLIVGGSYVGYSKQSRVYHQESINLRQASSQRIRWSSGRFQVLRRFGPSLLIQGWRARSLTCADAALPLLFPNPSLGMNLTFAGLVASVVPWLITGRPTLSACFSVLAVLQVIMYLIGSMYTKEKATNAAALVLAPIFLAWKMAIDILSLCGVGRKRWTRTERRLS